MDCVFTAYSDYIKHKGDEIDGLDFSHYRIIKYMTHGRKPQYTFGGAIPFMIKLLNSPNEFIRVQYSLYTCEDYLQIVKKDYLEHQGMMGDCIEYLNKIGEFVDEITIQPAIYTLLFDQHAVFSTTVPENGYPIMAIQI